MAAKTCSTASKLASASMSPAISASRTMIMTVPCASPAGAPPCSSVCRVLQCVEFFSVPKISPPEASPTGRIRCRARSVGLAAGRDRPDDLDLAVAHADIPVVDVAGGIAMAGHEAQLLVDLEHATLVRDDAVLVGALDVFHVVAAVDEG